MVWPHSFVESDHEISPPSADSKRAVVSICTKYWLSAYRSLSLPRKSVVRLTDHLNMTIVVDWDNKPNKQIFVSPYYIDYSRFKTTIGASLWVQLIVDWDDKP